jgi:hypothetical protein
MKSEAELPASIQQDVTTAIAMATQMEITNPSQFSEAATFLTEAIKPLQKAIEEVFEPICSKANAAHKEATKQRKAKLEPVLQLEKIVKSKMAHFLEEVGSDVHVDGVSKTTTWSAEVEDFGALVSAVARGEAPIDCLLPNQKRLNEMAKGLQDMLALPGVTPRVKTVLRALAR